MVKSLASPLTTRLWRENENGVCPYLPNHEGS